jgi:hypothetical protein
MKTDDFGKNGMKAPQLGTRIKAINRHTLHAPNDESKMVQIECQANGNIY